LSAFLFHPRTGIRCPDRGRANRALRLTSIVYFPSNVQGRVPTHLPFLAPRHGRNRAGNSSGKGEIARAQSSVAAAAAGAAAAAALCPNSSPFLGRTPAPLRRASSPRSAPTSPVCPAVAAPLRPGLISYSRGSTSHLKLVHPRTKEQRFVPICT
jgi:hypothetical protein